jgi:hypothetical protein
MNVELTVKATVETQQRRYKSTTHDEMFFHVREPFGRYKAGTVFFRKEEDGWWHASVARCSVADHFSRPMGRSIARRRYFGQLRTQHRAGGNSFCNITATQDKPDYERAKAIYLSGAGR